MLGLTDLPGHDGKVTSDMEMIFISNQKHNGGNRDYCSHFSVTFETTGRFLIAFCKVDIGKKVVGQSYRATAET